jgi:hypothetical protein
MWFMFFARFLIWLRPRSVWRRSNTDLRGIISFVALLEVSSLSKTETRFPCLGLSLLKTEIRCACFIEQGLATVMLGVHTFWGFLTGLFDLGKISLHNLSIARLLACNCLPRIFSCDSNSIYSFLQFSPPSCQRLKKTSKHWHLKNSSWFMKMPTFLQETKNLKTRLAIWITLKSEADPPKAAWRRAPTTEQSSRNLHRPKDASRKNSF